MHHHFLNFSRTLRSAGHYSHYLLYSCGAAGNAYYGQPSGKIAICRVPILIVLYDVESTKKQQNNANRQTFLKTGYRNVGLQCP